MVSTSQSTYCDGPAPGSPRQYLADTLDKPVGTLPCLISATQQAKSRREQRDVAAMQRRVARHPVFKLRDDIFEAAQKK